MKANRRRRRVRVAKQRNRAQRTNRSGDPRVELVPMTRSIPVGVGDPIVETKVFPVGPVGRFSRAVRRMNNYVAHGEWLERELGRAETPSQREGIQRQLLAQINKVAAYADRLERR